MKEQNAKNKLYTLEEAMALVKKTARTRFDESVEVHLKLGIDPQKGEQQVRGTVSLPYGTGKSKKVAVFVEPDLTQEAKSAGGDLVGGEELIAEIKKSNKCDFEVAVATPKIMKSLTSIAKILGPRGLMPSPKSETVTTDIKKTVQELKKGKVTFKNDDGGNVHQIIGKISFDQGKLIDNFKAFLVAIKKAKPASAKGTFIKGITLCSTMGKGIKVAFS